LEGLKKQGHRIFVFLQCDVIPEYISKEFSCEQVNLIPVPSKEMSVGKSHRLFILFTHFLIDNGTTRVYFSYSRHYLKRSVISIFLYQLALTLFGRLGFLKPVVRKIEFLFFKEKKKFIIDIFDKYDADLVFSTSITSCMDNIFMKEAHRRKIKTVTMTKSWDNATKMYYRFVPDYFLVQNNIIKEKLIELQDVLEDRIFVVGFPQFDWYVKKDIIKPREEHLINKGLDPSLPVIFFGSQGIWYKEDYQIALIMHKWIMENKFVKPCQMIIRPHFTNVKNTPLLKLKGLPRVAYDDGYLTSDVFSDNWDPSIDEIIDFVNTMYHSDVVVVMLSTIALDAACFDKPIINTLFGGTYRKEKDVTDKLANVVHYKWVFDTHGVTPVNNETDLLKAINMYLENPSINFEGRKKIKDYICNNPDGKSSEKIVSAINFIINK